MAIFLPIAAGKDWICNVLDKNSFTKFYGDNIVDPAIELDVPLRISEMNHNPREALKSYPLNDMDLNATEEGFLTLNQDDEFPLLERNYELSSWEVVKCSLCLAPIWFITEVSFW